MTENEKARELIATSETTVKVDPQNGWYLKRFAALQFEGSVDNFSTNMPIHVLEQQLPKDDTDEACEALDSCGVKFELDGGDRIMVEDELRQDALSVFDEYDIDAEEV